MTGKFFIHLPYVNLEMRIKRRALATSFVAFCPRRIRLALARRSRS